MADSRPTVDASSTDHAPSFESLGLPRRLVEALAATGVTAPFPIQSATLPSSLAGCDVLGKGRTGSGKTLAFAIPVVARLAAADTPRGARHPRALILAPTRELARQILAVITPLAEPFGLKAMAIFGGVPAGPQQNALRRGVDIVVACPGRLEDLLNSRSTRLSHIEITVLDEADHMADLGFLPGVKRLLDQTPRDGQRLLFSATLDDAVGVLVKRYLQNPVTHSVGNEQSAPVEMDHHVFHVSAANRLPVLVDLTSAPGRTVVFTRTKFRAKSLARQLVNAGVPAVEMHGNLAQNARVRNLEAFSSGEATVLVATDIAARGLHVDDVELVVHADPPVEHKAYLHRSGRTARAGAKGTVITLATDEQRSEVTKLTRKAGISPTVTAVELGHEVLTRVAPGERVLVPVTAPVSVPTRRGNGGGGRGSAAPSGRTGNGGGRGGNGGGRGSAGGASRGNSAASDRPRNGGTSRNASGAAPRGATATTDRPRGAGMGRPRTGGAGGAGGARRSGPSTRRGPGGR